MKKTKVTYGKLDRVLRSLGFSSRLLPGEPPTCLYEHKETGASFMLPRYGETKKVLDYHLVGARTTLDLFGIAEPKIFNAKLQKAG